MSYFSEQYRIELLGVMICFSQRVLFNVLAQYWLTQLKLGESLPKVQEAHGHRVFVVPQVDILLLVMGVLASALAVRMRSFG